MPAYQPPSDHRVWFGGTRVNAPDWASTGLGVHVDAIEGWEGSVEVEDNREPAPGRDGELANTSRMRGREIIISGTVNGSSWEDVQTRKRTLAGVFAPSSDEVLLKVPKPDAAAGATYADYCVTTLGAVAHWRLGGSTATAAGDNYEGTAAYDLTFSGSPTYGATGVIAETSDTAVDFDGSSDYGVASYAAALNPAAFTVSAWVNSDAIGAVQSIYESRDGTTDGFRVQLDGSGYFRIVTCDGANRILTASTARSADTWYHVVAGNDGTDSFIYVNGVSDATPAANGYTPGASADAGIGASPSGGTPFDGTIQAVTLWDRVLTAAEIAHLYTLGSVGYATSDMTNYERVTCRVVEPIRFEELDGPSRQTFIVALRASDPRIYDDVLTTDSDTGTAPSVTTSNTGTVAVPATLTLNGPVNGPWRVTNTTTGELVKVDSTYDLADDFAAEFDTDQRTFVGGLPYADLTDTLEPEGYWKCDDTSGTSITDSSGNSYTITTSGTITWSQTSALAEGAGTAMQFGSGASALRTITSDTQLQAVNAWTWSTWVKLGSTSGRYTINTYDGGPGNFGYIIEYDGTSGIRVQSAITTSSVYFPHDATVTDFNHWVVSYSGGTFRMYVNGTLVGTNDINISNYASGGAFLWLRENSGATTCTIDELTFWTRGLAADEIQNLYLQGSLGGASTSSRYDKLDAALSSWPLIAPGSNTLELTSDNTTAGTDSGTSLTVAYRPARI